MEHQYQPPQITPASQPMTARPVTVEPEQGPEPEPEITEAPASEPMPTMDDLRALASDLDDIDAALDAMDANADGLESDEAEAGQDPGQGQTPSFANR